MQSISFKRFFITLLFALLLMQSWAYDFAYDGLYFNILSKRDRTVEVTYRSTDESGYVRGNITIPSSVSSDGVVYSVISIGENAFIRNEGLTSVSIPSSVTSIGYLAFAYCSNLTEVVIPNSVTHLGISVFGGCKNLISVNIPNSITEISDWTFDDCNSLTSLTLPDSVTSIGEWAFNGCYKLTSINIPNSVTSIAYATFRDCTSLTSLTIPPSVTFIDKFAFCDCHSLTSIDLPSSITAIGSKAFDACINLTSVTCHWTDPITCSEDAFYSKIYDGNLYVPLGTKEKYDNSVPWYRFNNIIEVESPEVEITDSHIYLSIKNADNGFVKQIVQLGNQYTFVITPNDGWQIESVSFNGVDVTSELDGNTYVTPAITSDSELLTVYKSTNQGSVKNVVSTNIKVVATHDGISITSDGQLTTAFVYNVNGQLLKSCDVNFGTTNIDLQSNGVYIVKIGNQTYKVVL